MPAEPTPAWSRIEQVDLEKARKSLGISRQDFAALLGIELATLGRWEAGETIPMGSELVLLNVIWRYPQAVRRTIFYSL